PGAASLVRVAVRADDDLGVLAPLAHVEHANHLDVLARPHAACAQDTGAHVMPDHWVAGPLVAVAQDQVPLPEGCGNDPVAHDILLELVAGSPPHPARNEFEEYVVRYGVVPTPLDRKSTRLNSSHVSISYAV